jgi:hypothetical protein
MAKLDIYLLLKGNNNDVVKLGDWLEKITGILEWS